MERITSLAIFIKYGILRGEPERRTENKLLKAHCDLKPPTAHRLTQPSQVTPHPLLPRAPARANRPLPLFMTGIKDIQLIGDEVAIRWNDGAE